MKGAGRVVFLASIGRTMFTNLQADRTNTSLADHRLRKPGAVRDWKHGSNARVRRRGLGTRGFQIPDFAKNIVPSRMRALRFKTFEVDETPWGRESAAEKQSCACKGPGKLPGPSNSSAVRVSMELCSVSPLDHAFTQ